MKRSSFLRSGTGALGLILLTGACGHRVSSREKELIKASVGAAAGELAEMASLEHLQAIATDRKATDPVAQKLGAMECILLQARARTLGREVAAELPLVLKSTDRIDHLSAELQGAVYCTSPAPFDPGVLAKVLRGDASAIEGLLQQAR